MIRRGFIKINNLILDKMTNDNIIILLKIKIKVIIVHLSYV